MEHGISRHGCVHALPGRLRVRIAALKKAPEAALQVEQALSQEPGVADVMVSPLTGSVLIYYDPARITPTTLLVRLEPYGLSSTTPAPSSLSELSSQLTRVVGRELVKLALTQVLSGGPVEVLCALL